MDRSYRITVLAGDGIGPEVTAEAVRVADAAASLNGFSIDWHHMLMGGAALKATGHPLPPETLASFGESDAILLGAVGDPVWDRKVASGETPFELRPEAGLLQMRKHIGLFANLRPVSISDALPSFSPLKSDVVRGTNLMVVRELTGGIYFGSPSEISDDADPEGISTMRYRKSEIERIARVAFHNARNRKRRVTSVDKANVLAVSQLWRRTVKEIHASEFSDVELEHMYVDNAAMQIVSRPTHFDVILTSNLFGDILSDLSAVLVGSLGMLPSASTGDGIGVFEPVHGSAPEIADQNIANPVGAILSAAMLFDFLGEHEAASMIENAVRDVFNKGYATKDVEANGSSVVTTSQFGELVCSHLEALTQTVS